MVISLPPNDFYCSTIPLAWAAIPDPLKMINVVDRASISAVMMFRFLWDCRFFMITTSKDLFSFMKILQNLTNKSSPYGCSWFPIIVYPMVIAKNTRFYYSKNKSILS